MPTRRGWMVCSASDEPYGAIFHTPEEADAAARRYPYGVGYHARPVNLHIEVLGTAPEPWLKGADR